MYPRPAAEKPGLPAQHPAYIPTFLHLHFACRAHHVRDGADAIEPRPQRVDFGVGMSTVRGVAAGPIAYVKKEIGFLARADQAVAAIAFAPDQSE